MLICPKCKLLYEKSTECIRCGSPLVEKTSSEKEEITSPHPSEISNEAPPIQKPKEKKEELRSTPLFDFEEKFPPKPTPKVGPERHSPAPPSKTELVTTGRVKKEEPETALPFDLEQALHGGLTDEQSSPKISPKETKREAGRPEKIRIRIPSLSFQNIGFVILIFIGGYLLWSIYSHLAPKKPNTNVPPSKEPTELLSPRPATAEKPLTPLVEPKVADSPPAPLPPIASKTDLLDEKEIEQIKKLFENIREANLQKNIDLFISCYSAAFKDLEGKKRETLKNWGNFTYINLSYTLREHSISGGSAGVIVEWVIRFAPKAGGKPLESKTVLDVSLNREPDGWKINKIKPIG